VAREPVRRENTWVRIAVDQLGGMFPRHRRVEIVDNTLEITDLVAGRSSGAPERFTAKLTNKDVTRLRGLAAVVARAGDQIDTESSGVDGTQTVMEVDDGSAMSRVEIRRGRTTGQEVWDLLDVVEGLADQQQAQM
jgi:hypothetical protein